MSHLKKKKALSSNSLRCTMRGRWVCFTLLGGGDGGGTHPLPHCQRNTLSCVLIEATIPPGALLLLCNVIRQLCLTAVLPPRYISLLRERRAAAQPHHCHSIRPPGVLLLGLPQPSPVMQIQPGITASTRNTVPSQVSHATA